MDTLFADAVALIEALDLKPVHACGLSMGGFVAMRLGARRPDLVRSLLLLDTSADPEPPKNASKNPLDRKNQTFLDSYDICRSSYCTAAVRASDSRPT